MRLGHGSRESLLGTDVTGWIWPRLLTAPVVSSSRSGDKTTTLLLDSPDLPMNPTQETVLATWRHIDVKLL